MRNYKMFAVAGLVASTYAFLAPVAHAGVIDDVVQGVAESAAKDAGQAATRTIGNTLNPGGNKIGGSVTGLSSEAGTQAEVELRGSYDNVAPLNVTAS